MLEYQIKTYEGFFWKIYKEAFKPSVKGFFRADDHRRSEFLNYFKYIQAYKTVYSEDPRKNAKWGDFIVTWVKTHVLSVWTSGLVFRYQEKPIPVPTIYEVMSLEESALESHIRAYEWCQTDEQRTAMLAVCRWLLNASADLYDELALS